MEELYINRIKLLLLAFLIFTIGSCVGTAAEIHVQQGPVSSNPIQAAVNSAHSGDVIIVEPGQYFGNIEITRGYGADLNDLVLMSASNNPADTIIMANNTAPTAVEGVITVKYKTNVTIKGFTISGASRTNTAGVPDLAGVHFLQSKQCTVENSLFLNDGIGVKVKTCTDGANVIRNNNINRTNAVGTGTGISIEDSGSTMVSQNMVSNQNIGIYVSGSNSRGSTLSGNTINQNADHGIELVNAKGVTIDGNTLNLNGLTSIYLSYSDENTLTNNNALMIDSQVNGEYTNAIDLVNSNSNIISSNYVNKAAHGIFLAYCNKNTVQNNKATGNLYGIAMRYSNNNKVINNNADGNGRGLFFTHEDSGNTISGNSANGCIDAGIHLTELCGGDNVVDNNIINSNQYNGILVGTHNNIISNNHASGNWRGISLLGSGCKDNTISNNIVNYSTGNGIRLENTSNNNKLVSNDILSSSGDGIYLFNSNNSYLDSNKAQGNKIGIHEENSSWVTIFNNTALYNSIGIRLHITDNSTVSKNTVSYSSGSGAGSGIDLNSALNNNIAGNFIISNDKGISMCLACRNNQVYNNYFNNPINTDIKNAANVWYIEKTKGKNVVGGPTIGGNFWASTGGDGFSQTAIDTDGDGIAQTAYTFTNTYGGNTITITDRFPLVSVALPVADFSVIPTQGVAPLAVQFTDLSQNVESRMWDFGDGTNSTEQNPAHTYSIAGNYDVKLTVSNKYDTVSKSATITVSEYKALPVADFSANVTSGYEPLSVQFTDASQNAAGWSWSFGDGATSTDQNPAHTYATAGTYNVNLVVSNANGTASKPGTISVLQVITSDDDSSSSHSSSGGSGGGGGGGSPEPQSNVEVKELSQTFVSSGKTVKFEFPRNTTPVVYLSFDSKKTTGKTTTIVEKLKGKSTLVSGLPSGEIYKHLNIWVGSSGFATSSNIENPVVCFKVEKSWVQDKKIDKSSITLNRYSDKKWNQLPASLSSEDDKYLYFTAQPPGFSPFVITGKTTAAAVQPAAGNKTEPSAGDGTQTKSGTETAAPTGQKTEQKESPSPSEKKSPGIPAFEAIYGIAGLFVVYLCRRK